MGWFHRETARVLATVIAFAAVGWFIYGARETLIAFVFAIFFAYLLEPMVGWLETKSAAHHSRGLAIAEVYLAVAVVAGIAAYFGGPALLNQGKKLTEALPGFADRLTSGQLAFEIGAKHGWSAETQQRAAQVLQSHRNAIMDFAKSWGARAAALGAKTIWLVLIPILSVFFLKDGRAMARNLTSAVEHRSKRKFLSGVIDDLNEMLAGFIRAQLIVAALSMVVYTVVLMLLRVQYAVALGVAGGFMEFIPVVGPFLAAVAIVGVAFLTSYSHIFLVLLFLAAWRVLQDYVVSPRLMSGKTELHPLAVIFAVLAGGEIAGVIGVYLSIPIMAALRILWDRYQRYTDAQSTDARPDLRVA